MVAGGWNGAHGWVGDAMGLWKMWEVWSKFADPMVYPLARTVEIMI